MAFVALGTVIAGVASLTVFGAQRSFQKGV